MPSTANFQVDPRLASLLGESYRSSEKALKELVDNAWDANAENVWIDLPDLWQEEPVVIRDDGAGMSEREIRDEYLSIANPRSSRKGKITPVKKRRVKGRKGIGKFSGLVTAGVMRIEAAQAGKKTTLTIAKSKILGAHRDLEKINLPIEVEECSAQEHGVIVTLSEINTRYNPPSLEKMREILVLEYGHESDFAIHLNGKLLAPSAIRGKKYSKKTRLSEVGNVRLRFTVGDEPRGARNAGIVTRVAGKIVGRPGFFGLEERDDIPPKIRNRIVGEIEADGLEEDLNADWEFLREDSRAYQQTQKWASEQLAHAAEEVLAEEVRAAKTRLPSEVKKHLARLPEFRRHRAGAVIDDAMRTFAGEPDTRLSAFITVLLNSLERDEFTLARDRLAESSRKTDSLSGALGEYGRLEMGMASHEAKSRRAFLDHLSDLAANTQTMSKQMQRALERNLWIFGPEYMLMSSDAKTALLATKYAGRKSRKTRAEHSRSLLLAKDVDGYHLLVEFKHPAARAGHDAENEAKTYRKDLVPEIGPFEIIIVAGEVDEKMAAEYDDSDTKFLSYAALIETAKSQYDWLMEEYGAL